MTVPYTVSEQMDHNWFQPKHRVALIFGMSKFDAVWDDKKKGDPKQAFRDLETVDTDCDILKDGLKKY